MKRCPKCNRTYPDDNQKFCTVDGGLLIGDKPFDPNATIQGTSAPLATPPPPPKPDRKPLPDFSATIATSSSAPTAVLPKKTGPTGGAPTVIDVPSPTPPPPPPPRPAQQQRPPVQPPQSGQLPPVAAAPKRKSKLPLILGILAILLILGVGAVVAAFFLVVKPRLDRTTPAPVVTKTETENVNRGTAPSNNTATETKSEPAFVPPPNTEKFTNSKANLEGKLADHYIDFSFYYPANWTADPKAGVPGASNFAKVERSLPPDFTQENFAVGWYTSKGTFAADEQTFPQLVEILGNNLAKNFKEYQKVSEGPTKVNSLDGYEFRFTSVSRGTEKGDIQLWGRVIFLPTGVAGDQTGATLIMLATSLAPELSGVNDVGEKGEMPVILESFRFGKNR
jgi:flagellar basal body-associated protein FliL